MKILVLNGPNVNRIPERNSELYGSANLEQIEKWLIEEFPKHEFKFYQSNIEGELISKVQASVNNFDALIINPGGYSHTSVALKDTLEFCKIPKVEVHLSNLAAREDFRQKMVTASSCEGYISGFKEISYFAAVYTLEKLVSKST